MVHSCCHFFLLRPILVTVPYRVGIQHFHGGYVACEITNIVARSVVSDVTSSVFANPYMWFDNLGVSVQLMKTLWSEKTALP